MWPQYSMFFFLPAVVIILVFFLLPFMNRKREPFGYKTDAELPDDEFRRLKLIYLRKVFLFSIPLTLAVSVINMYILSTFLGSVMLGLFILGLAGVNFIFYIQGYRAVRKCLGSLEEIPEPEPEEQEEEKKLPQW